MPADLTPADFRKLISRDNAVILEVGANDGEDTQGFLFAFPSPQTRVVCFEPDPRAIERWRARITDPRAALLSVALAAANGVQMFYQSAGAPPGPRWIGYGEWDKSGSLLAPYRHQEFDPWLRFREGPWVPCYRLDTLAADWMDTDLLWIDVQGAEGLVLRGGQQTLRRVRFVYAECSPRPNYHGQATPTELDALLPGFERVGWFGENLLWKRVK